MPTQSELTLGPAPSRRQQFVSGYAYWILAAALALTPGCQHPHERLNTPPQGEANFKSPHQAFYERMNENALLADMSLNDFHFVPHQARLTTLGESRLQRYAELLKADGGDIHYCTKIDDETLVDKRLAAARSYLRESCEAGDAIRISTGMPGGRGMPATDAVANLRAGMQFIPANKATSGTRGSGAGAGGNTPTGGPPSSGSGAKE